MTGIGIVSPLGNTPADFFNHLMVGKSGVGKIASDFSDRLEVRVAAQVAFDPLAHFSKIRLSELDRCSQFALVAASQAIGDSGMNGGTSDTQRFGIYLGTGMGGAASIDEAYVELYKKGETRVRPLTVPMAMNNAAASQIARDHGLHGPSVTISTACSSSTIAIGEAYRLIRHGYADCMLAGGSEALLTYGTIKAWEAMKVLTAGDRDDPARSCKPFSKDRSGLVLGEGAGMVVLEDADKATKRGARIYGELIGYRCSNDPHHIVIPSADGCARALSGALDDAGIAADDIDYINAHGTATLVGDRVETEAIKRVFGEAAYRVPVSSTKSMHGHMMGATGAVEFIAAVLAITHGAVPPTANLKNPDPDCDLDHVPEIGRHGLKVGTVMSNSFAFGGSNAVLIARAFG